MNVDVAAVDWDKLGGLLPAIVQHAGDGRVLMLGYMDAEALRRTCAEHQVWFFSRTRQRLWRKGETSGNVLELCSLALDCDHDSLLVTARSRGPTCHTGAASCFAAAPAPRYGFLGELERVIAERDRERPDSSYTTTLFESGLPRIAQKVGEEGVEAALAAVTADDQALLGEAADLVFHLGVLLRARGLALADVVDCLAARHRRTGAA